MTWAACLTGCILLARANRVVPTQYISPLRTLHPTPPLHPTPRSYDLPTDYNARLLQYKLHGAACTWRGFDGANSTFPRDSVYSVETYIHDVLASSSHRWGNSVFYLLL